MPPYLGALCLTSRSIRSNDETPFPAYFFAVLTAAEKLSGSLLATVNLDSIHWTQYGRKLEVTNVTSERY